MLVCVYVLRSDNAILYRVDDSFAISTICTAPAGFESTIHVENKSVSADLYQLFRWVGVRPDELGSMTCKKIFSIAVSSKPFDSVDSLCD